MKLLSFLFCFFAAEAGARDGWRAREAGVTYQRVEDGKSSPSVAGLRQALAERKEYSGAHPLKHLALTNYLHADAKLQAELHLQFEQEHPQMLKEALRSAGNLHNPKVVALWRKFPEVLRKTPTVREIEEILKEAGYLVTGVSHEKFYLDKTSNPPAFRSFVWLILEPAK